MTTDNRSVELIRLVSLFTRSILKIIMFQTAKDSMKSASFNITSTIEINDSGLICIIRGVGIKSEE